MPALQRAVQLQQLQKGASLVAAPHVWDRYPGNEIQVAQNLLGRAHCDIARPLPLLRRARWRLRALQLEREDGCFVFCRSAAWRPQASWQLCPRRPVSPPFRTCCRRILRPSVLRVLLLIHPSPRCVSQGPRLSSCRPRTELLGMNVSTGHAMDGMLCPVERGRGMSQMVF